MLTNTPSMTSELDQPPHIEMHTDTWIRAVTFSANGECLISGGDGVQVWRMKDGKRVAKIGAMNVLSLAVSKDGKWIAAGTTGHGRVYVWDAMTYEQVSTLEEDHRDINGVDFSPDSTRFVTGSDNFTVNVWDVATRQKVLGPLEHKHFVIAVKYSSQGDRIATATYSNDSIRVYDSNDGCLLVDMPIRGEPLYNNSLAWSGDQLFIISSGRIMQVEASTGLTTSEWPVSNTDSDTAIALSHHGEFLGYSASNTVAFRDTSTQSQLNVIRCTQSIYSIAVSADDHFFAIGGREKITVYRLPNIVIPFMCITPAMLDLWMQDRLTAVQKLLTEVIIGSANPSHHALANRALVHAHLQQWDAAIEDAERSIGIQPSVIGYIAKSVALTVKGSKEDVSRVYDLAFRCTQFDCVDALLLIKAVVLFIAGEHNIAISRIKDLITAVRNSSMYRMVLAYMYLLLGNSLMENCNCNDAIQTYELAQAEVCHYVGPHLHTIAFLSGWNLDILPVTIQQRICEALFSAGQTKEAGESFLKMVHTFDEDIFVSRLMTKWISDFCHKYVSTPETQWAPDFKKQCVEMLVRLGDVAVDAQQHENAAIYYSASLNLDPTVPQDVLLKRSKERAAVGLWEEALSDASEVIARDPSSPWGYERKYVAFGVAGHQKDMSDAFETMLIKMAQSPNPEIRERRHQYHKAQHAIRGAVQAAICNLPPVLIDTTSGRLCNKSELAVSFELSPAFAELTSSMAAQIDPIRIEREVTKYYRYVSFSHRMEFDEPSFEEVVNEGVYELGESPTHDKLRRFCKIVQDNEYRWGWSSSCCIDRSDQSVLQEALVSMFRWYQESALTVILLLGVSSPSQRGDIVNSIWTTRAWLFQEYHASKVVRFYNEDWTLYRNIDAPNHKESPDIVSEIEEAINMSMEALSALTPGLGSIREKLRLVSRQETSLIEDTAYSLFGIFSVSLPVVYGEGDKALGHLLSHLLTNSRDTSILAWTGKSGSFNSCLPGKLAVFHGLSESHTEPANEGPGVDAIVASLRTSSSSLVFLAKLNDRLNELPAPWFSGQEMKLPCIIFKIVVSSTSQTDVGYVFQAKTSALGAIEIETPEDLSQFDDLFLVHPWIDFLLDRVAVGNERETEDEDEEIQGQDLLSFLGSSNMPLAALQKRASRFVARLKRISGRQDEDSVELPQKDKHMQTVRFAVRLRQPFDALLLAPSARNSSAFRRVAPESRITVRIEDITAPILKQLTDGVRVLDVL